MRKDRVSAASRLPRFDQVTVLPSRTPARPIRSRSTLALGAVVLAAWATLLLGRRGTDRGLTPIAQRGRPREFTVRLLDLPGQQRTGAWSLSEERGHVVAVNLWATWCGPCVSETPALARLDRDLSAQGFRVVGISLDSASDREARVRAFAAAYEVNYPLAFPDRMSQMEAGLEGIPTTLLFDRHGRAAMIYVGAIRERSVRADVTELLREP